MGLTETLVFAAADPQIRLLTPRLTLVTHRPDAPRLSAQDGEAIAHCLGVDHPVRIESSRCCGWVGATGTGHSVCVSTAPTTAAKSTVPPMPDDQPRTARRYVDCEPGCGW